MCGFIRHSLDDYFWCRRLGTMVPDQWEESDYDDSTSTRTYTTSYLILQKLSGTELTVSSITQTGENVPALVEGFIDPGYMDVDIWMVIL